ncbi:MAG: hypothetical protein ACRDT6_09630 [Micromonosporaceae bacterium]
MSRPGRGTSQAEAPERQPGASRGRHRHPATRRLSLGIGLVVALVAGMVMLWLPTPGGQRDPAAPAASGPLRLTGAWPRAKVTEVSTTLADGTSYTPLLFVAADRSVGTAATQDGAQQRLLLLDAGRPRQLHSLDEGARPGFNAVVSDGKRLVWAETLPGDAGVADTTFWVAELSGGAPRKLTGDTGDVIFFGSQYDIQLVDGRLWWAAQPPDAGPGNIVTELRSVPLDGGEVAKERIDGGYALAQWPWLVTIGGADTGPTKVRKATGGAPREVPAGSGEMVTCGAVWCRVIVLGNEGVARLDLMRTDGSGRRRIAGSAATPAVFDVMLADRFEPLTAAARNGSAQDQRLLLYDAKTGRTVIVADAIGMVRGRDGFLWWTSGTGETQRWQVLDLRSLR